MYHNECSFEFVYSICFLHVSEDSIIIPRNLVELVKFILQPMDCGLTGDLQLVFEENCMKVVLSQFNSSMFGLNHFCVVSKTNLSSLFLFPESEFAIKKLVLSANSTGKAISFTS